MATKGDVSLIWELSTFQREKWLESILMNQSVKTMELWEAFYIFKLSQDTGCSRVFTDLP